MSSSSAYVEPIQATDRTSRRAILEQQQENQRLRRERREISSSSARSSDPLESNVERDLAGNGLSTGYRGAPITIVEFGDYECPFCAQFHTVTFPKIFKDYIATKKVRFVFRNYPLSFHPNANSAAMAVECARDATGDAVWLLHEAIFKGVAAGTEPTPDTIEKLLVTFGLSTTEVKACIKEGRKQSVIDQDIEDGVTANVSGTPSFWVLGPNGKSEQITGAQPYEAFKEVLDRMLK